MATPASLADVVVDDIEARYEFDDELGSGTSAEVFLASNRETGADVAIKVYAMEQGEAPDEEVLDMIKAEVQTLKKVNYPTCGALIEVVLDAKGTFAVVMELLQGGDVFTRLNEEGAPFTEIFAREVRRGFDVCVPARAPATCGASLVLPRPAGPRLLSAGLRAGRARGGGTAQTRHRASRHQG